jgi:hypothetical protein
MKPEAKPARKSHAKKTEGLPAHVQSALTNYDALPDAANVRLPVVCALNGITSVTAWRWSRAGLLPKPIKIGGAALFNVGDLRRLRAEQAAKAA